MHPIPVSTDANSTGRTSTPELPPTTSAPMYARFNVISVLVILWPCCNTAAIEVSKSFSQMVTS
ncbi:hypothetical protein BC937DRAFT_91084 [Endogone sp. FLAS-F59071]|nr:hypothetical protein BC937DRAFT_91084 [Endogone sp. FLAS-F59071]|eukprot:RUS16548.1 hypothetical protein BC937DRAFT_91084 [Endogone sp. FLAS-F59071]